MGQGGGSSSSGHGKPWLDLPTSEPASEPTYMDAGETPTGDKCVKKVVMKSKQVLKEVKQCNHFDDDQCFDAYVTKYEQKQVSTERFKLFNWRTE